MQLSKLITINVNKKKQMNDDVLSVETKPTSTNVHSSNVFMYETKKKMSRQRHRQKRIK